MLARARKIYRSFPERSSLRVEAMSVFLGQVVKLVNSAARNRGSIKLGEKGLAAFDRDLSRVQARLRTYRDFYTVKWPGDPSEWNAEEWNYYEEWIEGPILFYSGADWRRLYSGLEGGFGMPRGGRPDYLEGWSLTNQVFEAREHQVELVETVWGYAQLKLGEMTSEMAQDMKEVGRAAVEWADEVVTDAVEYVKKGVIGVAKSKTFWLVLAGAGVFVLSRRRRVRT